MLKHRSAGGAVIPAGSISLPHAPWRLSLQPYALALLLVALALATTLALHQVYDGRPPMFPLFAAIWAAAWLGGSGPGYFAVAISLPLGFHFYSTSQPLLNTGDVVVFVFFATCAFVGGALNSRRRETEENLRSAHRQLLARASELQRANDALIAEMSERRRAEATLENTRRELARVSRLTSMAEMAASIAHEINQPLTAVVTNADTCVRWLNAPKPDLTEARDAAQRIVRDAGRAAQVVAHVRTMVRKAISERSQICIGASLTEVLDLLETEIASRNVHVRTDIAPGVPPLFGDRIQLQQVFVNLITNALESLSLTKDRPRELTITACLSDSDNVEIMVRDNGEGFSDGAVDRMFEAFVTTKPGGMGMGLSICRTIVEAHGGTLAAAPVTPHGAVFHVTLPLR